jgi:hypothetical protein
MSHLHGSAPDSRVIEFANSLEFEDTPYAISAQVAMAMCSDPSPPDIARSVAEVADRMLSGRLALEEAELLIAFARLAQLDGDFDRARVLADVTGPRAPWTVAVLAEVLGTIEGWTDDEWIPRSVDVVVDRVTRVAELRDRAPLVLADELERWR